MTNAEKYKNEIRASNTIYWAIEKDTGEIVDCKSLPCTECLFGNNGNCTMRMCEWLVSEYKERKEFTDDERRLIELLDNVEWVARDYDNTLWVFSKKPHKEAPGRWMSSDECFCMSDITSLPFAAIKPTDTEPTSRAEILGEK